jgi:hypothetical protein
MRFRRGNYWNDPVFEVQYVIIKNSSIINVQTGTVLIMIMIIVIKMIMIMIKHDYDYRD